jgi:hypothetical protein
MRTLGNALRRPFHAAIGLRDDYSDYGTVSEYTPGDTSNGSDPWAVAPEGNYATLTGTSPSVGTSSTPVQATTDSAIPTSLIQGGFSLLSSLITGQNQQNIAKTVLANPAGGTATFNSNGGVSIGSGSTFTGLLKNPAFLIAAVGAAILLFKKK